MASQNEHKLANYIYTELMSDRDAAEFSTDSLVWKVTIQTICNQRTVINTHGYCRFLEVIVCLKRLCG